MDQLIFLSFETCFHVINHCVSEFKKIRDDELTQNFEGNFWRSFNLRVVKM